MKLGFIITPEFRNSQIVVRCWRDNELFSEVFKAAIESFDKNCNTSFRGTLNIVNL